jgi:hypothetical protein
MNLLSLVIERSVVRISNALTSSLKWLVPANGDASAVGWLEGLVRIGLTASLVVFRLTHVIFHTLFDVAGFALGGLLHWLPISVQWVIVGLLLTLWIFVVVDWSGWMLAAAILLLFLEGRLAFLSPLVRLPRLFLAAGKSLALVWIPIAAWTWAPWHGWLLGLVAFQLTYSAFSSLLEGLTTSAASHKQRDRDKQANELVFRIAHSNHSSQQQLRVILYLRPFGITGEFRPNPIHITDTAEQRSDISILKDMQGNVVGYESKLFSLGIGVREKPSLLEASADFEMLVESALRQAGSFVALGRPGEALGAGRAFTTEEEWQELAARLMDAATLCVLVPSANDGTAWEVRYMVSRGYLSKCCVLMPPSFGSRNFNSEWDRAVGCFADVFPLPAYDPRGRVIRFIAAQGDSAPEIDWIPQQHSTATQAIARAVHALFPELPAWKVEGQEGWLYRVDSEVMRPIIIPMSKPHIQTPSSTAADMSKD